MKRVWPRRYKRGIGEGVCSRQSMETEEEGDRGRW